ncbi:hypothetical protein HBI56_072260 [Parastagonospora nodorum]|uniref:Copper acquisition factor BIM1-like domain-containing protein n=2 Tax=Phaeosphaeria nodorum (strain SN15 / ATCC MYA-4574 / FGSC 10173) TaxID=321614 RepID=A0A7U2EZ82_PHANO|nr:hypothetical protein SNOG_07849 [Parastagonospora nodorum SN15]KAH3908833.1 hypothetical protein HBH56_172730 [Parastagonospora nodorum]EAT85315.1 hypothetical protein SNOG_07849 [Parastagonospora nodorum SN15]KAH3928307.1 hypothetical protein HBH54_141290 [Parastagonospora nodorum]KAH3945493.1 hypothetical protein HBH53_146810 [Parastagonospora nodorum]KAH3983901.1 hypothetical protein HBH52_057580 [Parastagonospora nodorum]
MLSNTLLALALIPASLAHFTLDWPKARGFDDDKEPDFPCGGFNDVSSQRADFPISGGPIQLNMGHEQTNVAVYLAIGDNPGNAFNVVMRQQFVVTGLGDFCMGQLSVPAGVNVTDGTKATIQVVSNAHGEGGLYQCSDVTFRSNSLSQSDYDSHCKNNTGIAVSQQGMSGNPNGTSSGTPSSSGSAAASSPTGAASHVKAASWLMGAVGAAGLALL